MRATTDGGVAEKLPKEIGVRTELGRTENGLGVSCQHSAHSSHAVQERQVRSAHENAKPSRGARMYPGSMPSRSIILSNFAAVVRPDRFEELMTISFSSRPR